MLESLNRNMSTRRALITGGTGFVGSNLIGHLQSAGWDVHLLVREGSSATSNLPVTIHQYYGSIADVMQAVRVCRPQVTFHLASLFLASHTSEQIEPLIHANLLLGTQLLEALAGQHVSQRNLINTGTAWQSFHTTSYRPVNLYAATKQAFEDILAYYVDACSVRAVTLRLFDTYGTHDPRPKLIPSLIRMINSQETLTLSAGEQKVDLAHIDDVCRAYLRAAQLVTDPAHASLSVYAVSGGQRMTLRDLVALFEEAAGRRLAVEWGKRPYRPREVMEVWDGPSLPGWKPERTLYDGFRELLRSE